MLKRKYANRAKWVRMTKKRYMQEFMLTPEFEGVVGLLCMDLVEKALSVHHTGKELCIVNDGFQWLQHFPKDQHHTVTTVFDEQGRIIQWYIAISLQNGLEEGIAFMADLFLDIILLPTGEVIEKDKDEIEVALRDGIISQMQYELAYREFHRLLKEIQKGRFPYVKLARIHKMQLEQNLTEVD